jgi:hypothetical protein
MCSSNILRNVCKTVHSTEAWYNPEHMNIILLTYDVTGPDHAMTSSVTTFCGKDQRT